MNGMALVVSLFRAFSMTAAAPALVVALLLGAAPSAGGAETSTDVYYQTEGTPTGPSAPASESIRYPRLGSIDSRTLVWFVTQQHTYFGGFVLALPLFCVIMEVAGLLVRNRAAAARYDAMA